MLDSLEKRRAEEPNGEWAGGKPIGSRRRMGRIREDGKGKGLYRAEKLVVQDLRLGAIDP